MDYFFFLFLYMPRDHSCCSRHQIFSVIMGANGVILREYLRSHKEFILYYTSSLLPLLFTFRIELLC